MLDGRRGAERAQSGARRPPFSGSQPGAAGGARHGEGGRPQSTRADCEGSQLAELGPRGQLGRSRKRSRAKGHREGRGHWGKGRGRQARGAGHGGKGTGQGQGGTGRGARAEGQGHKVEVTEERAVGAAHGARGAWGMTLPKGSCSRVPMAGWPHHPQPGADGHARDSRH